MKLEDKASARRGATTHTQQTEKMASLCKDSIAGDPDKAPVVIIILDDSNDKEALKRAIHRIRNSQRSKRRHHLEGVPQLMLRKK
ncbi:hypothetical protein ACET3Z_026904 [Daucus carota]